jgi:hypothetical protein
MKSNEQIIKEDIRKICTYYSELGEGTAGYSLSEEQFEKLFDRIDAALTQREKESRRELLERVEKELGAIFHREFCAKRGKQFVECPKCILDRIKKEEHE